MTDTLNRQPDDPGVEESRSIRSVKILSPAARADFWRALGFDWQIQRVAVTDVDRAALFEGDREVIKAEFRLRLRFIQRLALLFCGSLHVKCQLDREPDEAPSMHAAWRVSRERRA